MMPHYWKFLLDGLGERDSGDVATRDGEVIGTWSLVDDVFYTFTPDGADEHLFFVPYLGMLCSQIAEWHEGREQVEG
jgi:hypothetical protein